MQRLENLDLRVTFHQDMLLAVRLVGGLGRRRSNRRP